MLSELNSWTHKLKEGLHLANNFHYKHGAQLPKKIKKIVFIGMGGSGIAGKIIKTFLDKKCTIPSFIIDCDQVPKFIDTDTLAIITSYSGNTWETVAVLKQLVEKYVPTIVLSNGGKLVEIAEKKNIPIVLFPEVIQPRVALGYFLGFILGLFGLMDIIDGKKIIDIFIKQSEIYIARYKDASAFKDFLNVAHWYHRLYIFGVNGDSSAFAYRAQTQFNENSKVLASTLYFPELNHNFINGFTNIKEKPLILFFYTDFLSRKLTLSIEVTCEILKENGVILYNPPGLGDNWEGQLFHMILWSDYASYYLGKELKVQVAPVEIIQELKKKLSQKNIDKE